MNILRAAWAGVRIGAMLVVCIILLTSMFRCLLTPEQLRDGITARVMVETPFSWLLGLALCLIFSRRLVRDIVNSIF